MVVVAVTMAVPFYLPDGGGGGDDDDATLSMGAVGSSNRTGSSSSAGSSMQSSPHTTSSSTQTPIHSPLASNNILMAFCEAFYRYSVNNGVNIFHYPMPSSAPCSLHSPSHTSGDVFFPRSRSTQRTPRTSVSYNGGEEASFLLLQSPTVTGSHAHTQTQTQTQTNNAQHPQYYLAQGGHQHYHQHPHYCQHTHLVSYHNANGNATCCQHTPPTTPTVNAGLIASTAAAYRHFNGCHPDPAMRCRLTSTGEEENECHYEHNTTNWDEFDDRYENFTAGREHLQEFSGQIPASKKKKDIVKAKTEKRAQSFTWPAVVTVFVFAMGCGFLVAR